MRNDLGQIEVMIGHMTNVILWGMFGFLFITIV